MAALLAVCLLLDPFPAQVDQLWTKAKRQNGPLVNADLSFEWLHLQQPSLESSRFVHSHYLNS